MSLSRLESEPEMVSIPGGSFQMGTDPDEVTRLVLALPVLVDSPPLLARAGSRGMNDPGYYDNDLGFRIAATVPGSGG